MARASLTAFFAVRSFVLASTLSLSGCFLVPSENASYHNVNGPQDSALKTLAPLRAKALSVHSNTSCAISTDDELLCWGARGAKIPTSDFYAFSPVKIEKMIASDSFVDYSFAKVQEVVQDASDICAVSAVAGSQGMVGCWGINAGQKLLWSPGQMNNPMLTKLSMGQGFGCGIEAGGELGCFGNNAWGTARTGGTVLPYHYVTRPRLGEFLGTVGALSFGGIVHTIAVQADGKILLGGSFSSYRGYSSHGIVRLWPDGSIDPSFVSRAPGSAVVRSIVFNEQAGVQKIIIGGNFASYDGVVASNLAQILPSGSLDTVANFAGNVSGGGINGSVLVVARQMVGGVPTFLVGAPLLSIATNPAPC
ncbi:MAG TPA: delta-60 repeat domain-containing protein [Bdellovibrionota bacterium]|jgi:hypothetical protein|nr:delta-60 repeat domain-containing protein [Bdellovibrionota bacterium]